MNIHYKEAEAIAAVDLYADQRAHIGTGESAIPTLASVDLNSCRVVLFSQPTAYRLAQTAGMDDIEETALRVQGVLCGSTLPPLQYKPNIKSNNHVLNLRQYVKVTGLGSTSFAAAAAKFAHIHSKFKAILPIGALIDYQPSVYEGFASIETHARYFTERKRSPDQRNIPFKPMVDPLGILEGLRSDAFIHGVDNEVEYWTLSMGTDGHHSYVAYNPASFRAGDIVEVTVAFMCIPVKDHKYKLVMLLRSLGLLTSTLRQDAENAMKSSPMRGEALELAIGVATLKRKTLFVTEDGVEHTRAKLANTTISDTNE